MPRKAQAMIIQYKFGCASPQTWWWNIYIYLSYDNMQGCVKHLRQSTTSVFVTWRHILTTSLTSTRRCTTTQLVTWLIFLHVSTFFQLCTSPQQNTLFKQIAVLLAKVKVRSFHKIWPLVSMSKKTLFSAFKNIWGNMSLSVVPLSECISYLYKIHTHSF